jgi:ribbon-helix-helix CopG family protein
MKVMPTRITGRGTLRITDLKQRRPGSTRLMNVKLPVDVADAIDHLAKRLGTSKTEVVIALLNEGLAVVPKGTPGHRRSPAG